MTPVVLINGSVGGCESFEAVAQVADQPQGAETEAPPNGTRRPKTFSKHLDDHHQKGAPMTRAPNRPTSLLHRLGVVGPVCVRAFRGSGVSKIAQGIGASRTGRRSLLSVLAATLWALAFTVTPALAPAVAAGPPEKPLTTTPAKSITTTTATLEGTLNPLVSATAGYYFAYSPEISCLIPGFTSPLQAEATVKAEKVEAKVTELQPDKEYKFCLVATDSEGETPGNEVALTTKPAPPEVIEPGESASGVKESEATLGALINPNNQETTYTFEYATNAALTQNRGTESGASALTGFNPAGEAANVTLTGLAPHTTYYYRVTAENVTHEKALLGKVESFITGPLETPTEGLEANPIGETTATLHGVLNPGGAVNPGSYEFLYAQSSTTCEAGAVTPAEPATGPAKEPVQANIEALLPGATYTFCLRAHHEAEEVTSAPVTFTTPAIPPTVQAESESASEVTSDSATLHAEVNPGGAATTYHFEYGTSSISEHSTPESASIGSDNTDHPLQTHVQELTANTTYHYRIVATNAKSPAGVPGPDQTFTTESSATESTLPDGRSYELVTPPEKEGAHFLSLAPFYGTGQAEGRAIQASAAGNAIADMASQPVEAEPQGYAASSVAVLSTRGAGGWSSQTIAPPHAGVSVSEQEGIEVPLFSEDLSHALVTHLGPFTPLSPEASESTPYLRTNYFNQNVSEHCEGSYLTAGSCFAPLVTHPGDDTAGPFRPFGECTGDGGEKTPGYHCGPELVGASPDLSHVVMSSEVQLTSTEFHTHNGLYEYSGGRLALVSVFPAGEEPTNEVWMAGRYANGRDEGAYSRRAVSEDGERVLFITRSGTQAPEGLYLRDLATQETLRLDLPEAGAPGASGGGLQYMTASKDASRVFFLDGAGLTTQPSASGQDLYEYDLEKPEGERLTDLSADPGESADVQAVLGASDDGSYVYFAAGGALTPNATANPGECIRQPGNNAEEGCNVYVRHNGVTTLVAAGWINSYLNALSRVSPDGRWLAFMSPRSLTGYDDREAVGGHPDAEVYLYHAPEDPATEAGTLSCASCDPTGARPTGVLYEEEGKFWAAANVPGEPRSLEGGLTSHYQPRYLSDAGRLFFESGDALVPQDVDGVEDVYEYEPEGIENAEHKQLCTSASASGSVVFKPAHAFQVGGVSGEEGAGCVALISSGTSSEPSSFLAASESGGDVFILTSSRLTSANPGGANVYDAHECTGESPCISSAEQPPACATEASCKAPPTPQPGIYGAPSSATFSGPGNLAPEVAPLPKKVVTKKTVKCKRGFTKNKKNKCVPKKKKHAKAKKSAKTNRRAR